VRRSPARLVIALSVAATLAVFILYTSIAGAGTPQIVPTQIHKYVGQSVTLVGTVVATHGDAHSSAGMRFVLSDPNQHVGRVPVVYHGSVPDLYKAGRVVVLNGTMRGGRFVANNGSLSTKCPSKYAPAKKSTNT
jgi:cytochrome c-type biogenesis protein CcmE